MCSISLEGVSALSDGWLLMVADAAPAQVGALSNFAPHPSRPFYTINTETNPSRKEQRKPDGSFEASQDIYSERVQVLWIFNMFATSTTRRKNRMSTRFLGSHGSRKKSSSAISDSTYNLRPLYYPVYVQRLFTIRVSCQEGTSPKFATY